MGHPGPQGGIVVVKIVVIVKGMFIFLNRLLEISIYSSRGKADYIVNKSGLTSKNKAMVLLNHVMVLTLIVF
jgi:hypothetical protein